MIQKPPKVPEYVTSYFKTKQEADNRLAGLIALGYNDVQNGREHGQWYTRYRSR